MASNTHARERSAASQPYLATSSFGQSTAERCTRSMRKNVAEGSSSLPKRSRRSTTVSSQSSEDGDSVRLTKTGRVSKALKGQPVHTCDVCSKCYTRAEHLRRHLMSHRDHSTTTAQWSRSQDLRKMAKKDENSTTTVDNSSTRAPSSVPDIRVNQSTYSYSDNSEHTGFGAQYESSYDYAQDTFESTPSIAPPELVPQDDASFAPHFSTASYSYPPVTESTSWWQPEVPDLCADRSISPASLSSSTLPIRTGTAEDYSSMLGIGGSPSISAYSSPSMHSLCHFDQTNLQTMSLLDTIEQDARMGDDVENTTVMPTDLLDHSSLFWLEASEVR